MNNEAIRASYSAIVNLACEIIREGGSQRVGEYLSAAADGLVDADRGDAKGVAVAARWAGKAEGACEVLSDSAERALVSKTYQGWAMAIREIADTVSTL